MSRIDEYYLQGANDGPNIQVHKYLYQAQYAISFLSTNDILFKSFLAILTIA